MKNKAMTKGRIEPHGYIKLSFEDGKVVWYDSKVYPRLPHYKLYKKIADTIEEYFTNEKWEEEAASSRDEAI